MKRLRFTITLVWLLVGAAVGIFCIRDIYSASRQGYRGEIHAALIFLVFAAFWVSGAVVTMRNRKWGPPILYVGSAFGLLYAGLYWLFGGVEDTGWLYASGVLFLIVLSVVTLVGVRREVPHGL